MHPCVSKTLDPRVRAPYVRCTVHPEFCEIHKCLTSTRESLSQLTTTSGKPTATRKNHGVPAGNQAFGYIDGRNPAVDCWGSECGLGSSPAIPSPTQRGRSGCCCWDKVVHAFIVELYQSHILQLSWSQARLAEPACLNTGCRLHRDHLHCCNRGIILLSCGFFAAMHPLQSRTRPLHCLSTSNVKRGEERGGQHMYKERM